jgi:hypothetical protein
MSTALRIDGQPVALHVRPAAGRLTYRLRVPVPTIAQPVAVRIELRTRSKPWRPRVYATAPVCLRHRFHDDALCMWFERDPNDRRWLMSDGIEALLQHTRRHLFQEACCRAGEDWPGEQAPGDHRRPRDCPTCGGEGP